MINLQNKILPVALGAALLGGSVGALVMRNKPADTARTSNSAALLPNETTSNLTDANDVNFRQSPELAANNTPTGFDAATMNDPQAAYRAGFADGFSNARNGSAVSTFSRDGNNVRTERVNRVVYRNAPAYTRTRYSRSSSRRAYYDYQPQRRSFWQKHRDKLTVAGGTGGGALIGALIGGKKGAAIGALSGAAGSALYTYKIRSRNRRY